MHCLDNQVCCVASVAVSVADAPRCPTAVVLLAVVHSCFVATLYVNYQSILNMIPGKLYNKNSYSIFE